MDKFYHFAEKQQKLKEQDNEESNKKASSPGWDEPIGFDEDNLPVFNSEVFPNWLRDYINAVSESVQVAPDAPAMASISLLSSILSRKFIVKPSPDWTEQLATFTLVALPSSERKSPSHSKIISPLFNYEEVRSDELQAAITEQRTWYKAQEKRLNELYNKYGKNKEDKVLKEISSIEKEIAATKLITKPRLVTADATPEALAWLMYQNGEKMSILSPEGKEVFDMMAGRYSSSGQINVDIYLKSYTGEHVAIDRRGGDPIRLSKPCMTIGLFVQPSVIEGIGKEFQDRGVTSRFLYSLPMKMAGNRNMEPESIPDIVKKTFESNIEKMLRYESESEELTLEKEAGQLFLYNRYTTEELYKDDDFSESFKSWIGKLDGNLIRIAALLHIAEYAPKGMESIPKKIGVNVIQNALDLKKYFMQHAMKAYGVMGAKEDDENAKYVLEKIKNHNREIVGVRDLLRMSRKIKTTQDLRNILYKLEDMGYVKFDTDGKKEVLRINPSILSMENA